MALTVVNSHAAFSSPDVAFLGTTNFPFTPTSGNLLVIGVGGRDTDNSGTPTVTTIGNADWTIVETTSPMEYHIAEMQWKVADGTENGTTVGVNLSQNAGSRWFFAIEFNDPDVTTWQLDASEQSGSGATNVSSISSGSTGALSSGTGVVVVAGTSRTAGENLSFSGITGLQSKTAMDALDSNMFVDAGSANFGATYAALTGTSALEGTVTEGGGASRMGIVLGVFNDSAGGPTTVTGTASGTISASGTATGTVTEAVTSGTATGTISASGTATGTVTEAVFTGTATGAISASGTATAASAAPASYTEPFTYSDGTLSTVASGIWASPFDTSPSITSNVVKLPAISTSTVSIFQTSLAGPDHWAEADVTIGSNFSEFGVVVRSNNTTATYYRLTWSQPAGGQYTVYKRVAGTYTLIGSVTGVGITGTRRLRLECEGSTLRYYADGVLQGSFTDASISTGNYSGIEGYRTVSSGVEALDNFETGATVVVPRGSGVIAASATASATPTEGVTVATVSGTVAVSGSATASVPSAVSYLKCGTVDVDAVYIGTSLVDAIYRGSVQVF